MLRFEYLILIRIRIPILIQKRLKIERKSQCNLQSSKSLSSTVIGCNANVQLKR